MSTIKDSADKFVPPPGRGSFYRFRKMKASYLLEPAKNFPSIGLKGTERDPNFWISPEDDLYVEIIFRGGNHKGEFRFYRKGDLDKVLFEGEFTAFNTHFDNEVTIYGFCQGLPRIVIEAVAFDHVDKKEEAESVDDEDADEVGCAITGESKEESGIGPQDDLPPPTPAPAKYRHIGRPTRVIERSFQSAPAPVPKTEDPSGSEADEESDPLPASESSSAQPKVEVTIGASKPGITQSLAKKRGRPPRANLSKEDRRFSPPGTYAGLTLEGSDELESASSPVLASVPPHIPAPTPVSAPEVQIPVVSPVVEPTKPIEQTQSQLAVEGVGSDISDADLFLAFAAEAWDFNSEVKPFEGGHVQTLEDLTVAQLRHLKDRLESLRCTAAELQDRVCRVLA